MFNFLKNRVSSIGINIAEDGLYVSQLCHHNNKTHLQAGDVRFWDNELKVGSSQWQKWTVDTLKDIFLKNDFKGTEVVCSIPSNELIIEHLNIRKTKGIDLENQINRKIKQKTGLDTHKMVTKYLEAEDDNIIVLAVDKEKVDKYLAIYEKANLQIKSFGAWPEAITNCYIKFFGRRKSDIDSIAILIDIKANNTYLVICRHKEILFARSIATGFSKICENNISSSIEPLISQVAACKSLFESMYDNPKIDRSIFFTSSHTINFEREVFVDIAKKLGTPAQIGNCLSVVELSDFNNSGLDRRSSIFELGDKGLKPRDSWAVAFGLSLSN